MSRERVIEYYSEFDEWSRLDHPSGRFEFRRCMRVIDDQLEGPSKVLDLGGGPGRYSIALQLREHEATLIDLSPDNVAVARDKLIEAGFRGAAERARVGDARELDGVADDAFDAVVAFGPFYHITERDDLRRAAAEVARVTRPGGRLFAQFLPPLSDYVRMLDRAARHPTHVTVDTLQTARKEGVFHNAASEGFQEAVHLEASDATALFSAEGFETLDVLSVRGIAAWHEEQLALIESSDRALHAEFLDLIDETSRRSEVIAMGAIALYVGRL